MMLVNKRKLIPVVAVLFTLTFTGIVRHPCAAADSTRTAVDDKSLSASKHVDLHGDPLPEGAAMRLGTLQRRAVGALFAVTSDGQSIVTVREGKYVRIWDAANGSLRETRQLPSVSPGLSALIRQPLSTFSGNAALSPNGRWLATISPVLGSCTLWDVQTGKAAHQWRINNAQSLGPLSFSADGKWLALGGHIGDQAVIRVWDVRSGKETFATGYRKNCCCHCLAFSRNATFLIASHGTAQGGTYCWELATGRQVWYRSECNDSRMLLTPEDKILCPYCRPTSFDVATGEPCAIEKMPPLGWETRAVFSPDGRTLLLSTFQGTIVWDRMRGEKVRTLSRDCEEMVFFPDGKSVLTNHGSLRRLDLATGKPLWTDTFAWGHIDEVVALAFSADGRRLASTSADGTVRLWDAATGRPLRLWRTKPTRRPLLLYPREQNSAVLAISPDGCRILSAEGERLHVWDASSDKAIRTIWLPRTELVGHYQRIYRARISSDGRQGSAWFGIPLLGMMYYGRSSAKQMDTLAVWDLRTGGLLSTQKIEWRAQAVAADRRTLVAQSRFVDTVLGRGLARLEGMNEASPCTFAPDGSLVIGEVLTQAKRDGRTWPSVAGLRVWETATSKPVADLKGKQWMRQVQFSPGNRFIVTNDSEGVQLRRLPSGGVEIKLPLPEKVLAGSTGASYASSLAFRRDGRRLATGMPDGTILLWDIPLPASKQQRLATQEIESLWADLADADAAKAWQAVGRLAESPNQALAFLRGRVKPSPIAPAELTRKLLADLDSDSFAVREAAVKRLKELGLQAEPALRAALKAKPTLEQRRRIDDLLAELQKMPPPPTAGELRQLRALIVLERIGTPEARNIVEEATKGPPDATLTRQAHAALMCLR